MSTNKQHTRSQSSRLAACGSRLATHSPGSLKKQRGILRSLRHTLSMQGKEHEEHRMAMKSQSEMEFEKGTEKTKYSKTY